MSARAIIDGTAVAEPFVLALVGVAVLCFVVDRLRTGIRTRAAEPLDAPLTRRTELALLAAVVAIALGLRLVGWDDALTPVFWFSEVSTLYVDHWLHTNALWTTWLRELSSTEVLGPHDAALVLPVLAGFQVMIGPRFGLPVLCGAFFGGLEVVLAWAFGRRVRSQAFGLAFAALVAVSPLALTWSRLSGFCVAATAHVLLALLVAWEAGRRGSLGLAILTGLLAWTSIYHYYAARVAIPLAPLVLLAASQRAMRFPRGLVLVALVAATFVTTAYLVHGSATIQALWPSYGGYAGNKGERTLAEFLERNLPSMGVELRHTLERYFLRRRIGWEADLRHPGMRDGGLALLPVTLLGLVGLVTVVRQLRRQWLWLALAAAGLALPTISVMTSRRTLVFDLAWCAFAAHGLLTVVDGLGARFSRGTRARAAVVIVGAIGAYAAAAVFLLSAALARGSGQQIPFAEAGFGDGIACRRCLEAAKAWSRDMADGAFVVLFDNDVQRENRTSPGGLVAYGKIATLVAGTPERFVEGYALMSGVDPEPPAQGPLFDRNTTDFVRHLTAQLERTRPTRIVWHFERPTSWERWLADELVAAGGTKEIFPTPLSPTGGERVVTPWNRRADALAVLAGIAAGLQPNADSQCVSLADRGGFGAGTLVLGLAPDGPGLTTPPEWVATSFTDNRYKMLTLEAPCPIGAWMHLVGGVGRIAFLADNAHQVTYDLPTLKRIDFPPVASGRFGLNCAAFASGHWWVLDSWTGKVTSSHPAAGALPAGDWIGIAADPSGMLVLASGDQQIVVFDPHERRETVRFAARVSPSVRLMPDECAPVAVGADWIATLDLRTAVLSFYDRGGHDLGTRRLDRVLRQPLAPTAIAGAGHYLGVGIGTTVRTVEVRVEAGCGAGGGRAQP